MSQLLISLSQFDTLDVGVQDAFDQFLNERGVNENVAQFIPEYASYKEQQVTTSVRFLLFFTNFSLFQEYIKWLGKVKNFIDL